MEVAQAGSEPLWGPRHTASVHSGALSAERACPAAASCPSGWRCTAPARTITSIWLRRARENVRGAEGECCFARSKVFGSTA